MIRLEEVSLSVGGHDLLHDASWHLRPGERVGLVGRNGAGKTTLIRALLGELDLDRGRIHRRNGIQLGYLPQQAVSGSAASVWDEVRQGMTRLIALRDALQRAQAAVDAEQPGAIDKLGEAQSAFEIAGGYAWDERIGRVLHGLGFAKETWSRPCAELSGGWQMRVALARLLLSEPDVALLDEPTNHLDLHARTWLAEYLRTAPWTSVLVSHDRHLLDRVATRIVEVHDRQLTVYTGNFTRFLAAREEAEVLTEKARERQGVEIDKLQRFVDRFGAKATKAAQARSRQKRLDKIERIEAPRSRSLPRMRLPEPPASAQRMVRLEKADIGWPGHGVLISGLDLEVEREMRIALIGPNGCGKSTLLRTLAGELQPLAGRRVPGDRVRMGVFHQDLAAALPADQTGLEVLSVDAPLLDTAKLRSILGALGLSGDAALRPIGALSGGEKARVALASLSARSHNLLLLDEPTNHLDAETVEVLVRALKEWTGALILVTHDRYLVEQLATHVLRLEGEIELHEGVRPEHFERAVKTGPPAPKPAARTDYADRKKLQREQQRANKRLEALPEALEAAEAVVAEVDDRLVAVADDWSKASALGDERQVAQDAVDALYAEWERLEARLEELQELLA